MTDQTDRLREAHCPGCAGWLEPEYLRREPCPGLAEPPAPDLLAAVEALPNEYDDGSPIGSERARAFEECRDDVLALLRSAPASREAGLDAATQAAILAWFDAIPTGYRWSEAEKPLSEIAYRLSDARLADAPVTEP